MKHLGTSLVVLGFLIMALGLRSFDDLGTLHGILLIAGCLVAVTGTFIRSRVIEGYQLFEITDQDRKQAQELRATLSLKRLAGALMLQMGAVLAYLGLLGFVMFIAADNIGWITAAVILSFGVLLLLAGKLLLKRQG